MMIEPIEVVVVLNTTQDAAFDAFVAQINAWWPVSRFSVSGGTVSIDPCLGGQISETDADGAAHVWGHVTAWKPGHHIEISWYVGEAAHATDISVHFAPTDDGRTGVTLVHAGWDRLGDEAMAKRTNYILGWDAIFTKAYAAFVTATCPTLKESPNE